MKSLNIDNLVIELTRECNMCCDHCLRGDAQCLDMDLSNVDKVFKQVDRIYELTLTGGEPSLKPEIINGIIDLAKANQVEISNFYMATNGLEVSNEFLLAVMNLYCYCTDNESSQLAYTIDQYHEQISSDNVNKLNVFRFASSRSTSDEDHLIMEGRAVENYCDSGRWQEPNSYQIDEWDDTICINEGLLYLNCLGNIVSSCDLSYESQDLEKFIICNVNDNILESVIKYQQSREDSEETA